MNLYGWSDRRKVRVVQLLIISLIDRISCMEEQASKDAYVQHSQFGI